MEFAAALLFSLIFDAGFGCAVRRGRRGCNGRVESCCGCVCEAGAPLAKCNGCTISFFYIMPVIFFLGGFYVGFLKNGTSIFHGSSVRMGHKIYILPIYSTYTLLFHYTMPARIVTSARALNYRSGNRRRRGPPARNNTRHQERADLS